MPLKAQIIITLLSVTLFVFVLNLIRKRRLRIEHSVLWLLVSATILIASIWPWLADRVALFLGVEYPPALFLAVAIFFSLAILMHFSIELSKLKEQNKDLTQELAIYKNLLNQIVVRNHKSNDYHATHEAERTSLE